MHTDHLFVHTDDAVSVVTDIIPRVFPEILEVMRFRKISEKALGLQPDVLERFEQRCEASIRSFAHPYMGPISHGGGAVTRRERAGAFSRSQRITTRTALASSLHDLLLRPPPPTYRS